MPPILLDDVSFFDVVWWMIIMFFWVMAIWVFIAIFTDIFRRNDHSGWAKAGWCFLIFVLPFLGALIYIIARPKMTEQDRQMIEQAQAVQQRLANYSPSEEISKAQALLSSGAITQAEFDELKRRAMISA